MGCRRFHQLSGLLRTVTGLDTFSKSGTLGPSLGGSVAEGSRGTFGRWPGRVKARIPLFAERCGAGLSPLPPRSPAKGTDPASSRLRTQSKRTNATLKPTLTTKSHGPQPRLARQWPLPWPEASRTGTRWNEKEWYRDEPSIDRIGKAIPRSRTAQPVKKPKMRATPPGSKHSGPHVHIQRILFSSSFPLSLGAL